MPCGGKCNDSGIIGAPLLPFYHTFNSCTAGSIAQGLEHWSCKPGVVSSNLTGALKFFTELILQGSIKVYLILVGGSKCRSVIPELNHQCYVNTAKAFCLGLVWVDWSSGGYVWRRSLLNTLYSEWGLSLVLLVSTHNHKTSLIML